MDTLARPSFVHASVTMVYVVLPLHLLCHRSHVFQFGSPSSFPSSILSDMDTDWRIRPHFAVVSVRLVFTSYLISGPA